MGEKTSKFHTSGAHGLLVELEGQTELGVLTYNGEKGLCKGRGTGRRKKSEFTHPISLCLKRQNKIWT